MLLIFVTKLRRKQIWSLNIFGMNIKSVERETVKSLISKIINKRLSGDMNNLYDLIYQTDLFEDMKLRKSILADAIPQSL